MPNSTSILHGSTGKRKASAVNLIASQAKKKKSAPKGSSQNAESSKASTATSRRASVATEEEEESRHGDDTEVIEIDLLGNERQKSSSPEINSEDELGMLMSVGDECY
jgi:hypothetical protein